MAALDRAALTAREIGGLLGADAARAEQVLGASIVGAHPLSPFRPLHSDRAAFKLVLADGRAVKLRRFSDGQRLQHAVSLLAASGARGFSRVLHHGETFLLEEWVEGVTLAETPPSAELLRQAGTLLARLHTTTLESDGRSIVSTASELAAIGADVERLQSAAVVDGTVAARILQLAAAHDPGTAAVGLIHGDFCAENIVLESHTGRLRVVDNEQIRIGPLDGDLVRSAERWPLAGAELSIFLQGYRRFRDPAGMEAHRAFWRIRSLALSARVRLQEQDLPVCRQRVQSLLEIA